MRESKVGSSTLLYNNRTVYTCPYHEHIGSLLYFVIGTRPEIAFAVGRMSHFVKVQPHCIGAL